MTILITGANGFIGRNLHDFLNTKKDSVFRPVWTNVGRTINQYVDYQCDLTDLASVRKMIETVKPETIIHLAGYSTSKPSTDDPSKIVRENIVSTQNLLEALPEDKKTDFIFTSSILVYGTKSRRENEICEPTSVYGMTKLACEHLLSAYSHKVGNSIIFRLCAAIGKHMTHGMLYDFLGKRGQWFDVIGSRPGAIKPFIHVEDICQAIWQCLTKNEYNGVYNLCPSDNISVEDVALRVIHSSGYHGRVIRWNPDQVWKGDVQRIVFDNTKFVKEFFPIQSSCEAINKVLEEHEWRP